MRRLLVALLALVVAALSACSSVGVSAEAAGATVKAQAGGVTRTTHRATTPARDTCDTCEGPECGLEAPPSSTR